MIETRLHLTLDLMSVRCLTRLEQMRQVRLHTCCNNPLIPIILPKLSRVRILLSVEDKELMTAYFATCYMCNQMLEPFKADLVVGSALLAYQDTPIARQLVSNVPRSWVVLSLHDDEGRDRLPGRTNNLP
jgi:hypothetical protein